MKEIVIWGLLLVLLGGTVDLALLKMEERGWINYRRNGISFTAMAYHMMELQSIYDPGVRQLIEIQYQERKQEDESGDPQGGDTDEEQMA